MKMQNNMKKLWQTSKVKTGKQEEDPWVDACSWVKWLIEINFMY